MSVSVRTRNPALVAIIRLISRIVLSPFFKLHIKGSENLPEHDAFILVPKHQRWVDIPIIGLAVSRPLYFIAKYELFIHSLSGWFLSSLGGIPLNRKRPLESRESLKRMMASLEKGDGVVIFPEGTYYENRMGPGHAGLIRMILSRTEPPFLPMGIRYSRFRGRTHVRIKIGIPLYRHPDTEIKDFLDKIMLEIAKLSGM
ncbi:MAG: 1-acyl-sn-glycerol-3-phosphate acyltransferase [Deltaproteobacteria bacterium]|nr:1-acyl-sn-glycerol-3-phosphate acyltransferase [Deltaproteobacteria bacterium]